MKRITLDWDFKKDKLVRKYIKRIIRFGPTELTIKKSKRGYHVFIWCVNSKCRSEKERFLLREYFGDDKKHIEMDKLHKFGRQTLFKDKKKLR